MKQHNGTMFSRQQIKKFLQMAHLSLYLILAILLSIVVIVRNNNPNLLLFIFFAILFWLLSFA